MPPTVWLGMTTLEYLHGGGFLWTYLNWALSLRSAGCDVVWMEADKGLPAAELRGRLAALRRRLAQFGLGD